MPNIAEDLQKIMEARYGKDVRQSIHDAIYDINEVVDGNVQTVTALTERAETAANSSESDALVSEGFAKGTQNGVPVTSESPYYENNAEYFKNEAESIVPEGYAQLVQDVTDLNNEMPDKASKEYLYDIECLQDWLSTHNIRDYFYISNSSGDVVRCNGRGFTTTASTGKLLLWGGNTPSISSAYPFGYMFISDDNTSRESTLTDWPAVTNPSWNKPSDSGDLNCYEIIKKLFRQGGTWPNKYDTTVTNSSNVTFTLKSDIADFQTTNIFKALAYLVFVENMSLDEIQAMGSRETVNLFLVTKDTFTQDGVTCTNNGDGTYTINSNGTLANNVFLQLRLLADDFSGKPVKLVGGVSSDLAIYLNAMHNNNFLRAIGFSPRTENTPSIFTVDWNGYELLEMGVMLKAGKSYSNQVIKPMITTNLNATYDDFVAYTGYSGKLNGDVAEARGSIGADHWKTKNNYAANEYCIYKNTLWKSKIANVGQAPAEGTYWTKTSITKEIKNATKRKIIYMNPDMRVTSTETTYNTSISFDSVNLIVIQVIYIPANIHEVSYTVQKEWFNNGHTVSLSWFNDNSELHRIKVKRISTTSFSVIQSVGPAGGYTINIFGI